MVRSLCGFNTKGIGTWGATHANQLGGQLVLQMQISFFDPFESHSAICIEFEWYLLEN